MRAPRTAILALAAMVAVPVVAAPPTALTASERHDLMLSYAGCVAREEPTAVRTFLFDRRSVSGGGDFERLASKKCVVESGIRDFRSFRVQAVALAGAWGELAFKNVPASVEPGFKSVAPLAHARERSMTEFDPKGRLNRAQFAALVEQSNRDRAVMVLGECVVRAAPALARDFVATPFGSAEERAAVSPLGPALTGCVNGGSVKLLPQQLRAALAFNYVRLAVAARPELAEALF